jgi:uncharacterized protein (DUF924 family)
MLEEAEALILAMVLVQLPRNYFQGKEQGCLEDRLVLVALVAMLWHQ